MAEIIDSYESIHAELARLKKIEAAADRLYSSYTNQLGDTTSSENYRLMKESKP